MIMMKIMIMMKRMMIMKGGKRDSGRGGGGRKEIQRRPPVGGGLIQINFRVVRFWGCAYPVGPPSSMPENSTLLRTV